MIVSIRRQVEEMPRVKAFLESVSRNSKNSKSVYATGLTYFQNFLAKRDLNLTAETVLQPLSKNEINIYELLDNFIAFLISSGLSVPSIRLYITALRSYLAYHDIDVIPSKFKRKVRMPKLYREDEEPIDAQDIRKILLCCNNRRLKAYLLILASGGMRATEGLYVRLKDIDFSISPTKIRIRKEYAKTRVARDIYISDEATRYLRQWIDWKYRDKGNEEWTKHPTPNDLVFNAYRVANNELNPRSLYIKALTEFEKLLSIAELDERKEGGLQRRRKITLHSFRRFVKTVISNQVNQDYSEWFLGHSKSPYYTLKESERAEIYRSKVMKYLTFLDYTTLETTGKNIEAKLSEKEREIQVLRQKDSMNSDAISDLSDQLLTISGRLADLEKKNKTTA